MAEDRVVKLRELATLLNLTLEDLVRLSIESLLSQPEAEVKQQVEYTLDKNLELYQRLAR